MERGRIKPDFFLNVLSENKKEEIHKATLEILEKTGVKIQDEETLARLQGEGCKVDFDAQTARMNEAFVMDGLKKHPHEFVLRAVDQDQNCLLKSGESFLVTTSPGLNSINLNTWEPKIPNRKEFYDYMCLVDRLEEIDLAGSFPWGGFEKVPQCMAFIESLAAKIRCSGKALWEGTSLDNYRFIVKMAKRLNVDVWLNTNPTSPLTFMKDTVDEIKFLCREGMPFTITSGPILGVSGPVTMAGALALNNADILAGNAIAQMYCPGTRCMAGGMLLALNMKTGSPVFANAASYLTEAAFAQMWRCYGVPCVTNSPGWTNAKQIDYQAAYETSTGFLMLALAGANVVPYAGGLTAELTAHPVKAILDRDVVKMVRRIRQGIAVDEESLALSVIKDVGFAPGSYLDQEHTIEWMRSERCDLEMADLDTISEWIRNGKETLLEKGIKKWRALREMNSQYHINDQQEKIVEETLEEARQYYYEKGLINQKEWENYRTSIETDKYPFE